MPIRRINSTCARVSIVTFAAVATVFSCTPTQDKSGDHPSAETQPKADSQESANASTASDSPSSRALSAYSAATDVVWDAQGLPHREILRKSFDKLAFKFAGLRLVDAMSVESALQCLACFTTIFVLNNIPAIDSSSTQIAAGLGASLVKAISGLSAAGQLSEAQAIDAAGGYVALVSNSKAPVIANLAATMFGAMPVGIRKGVVEVLLQSDQEKSPTLKALLVAESPLPNVDDRAPLPNSPSTINEGRKDERKSDSDSPAKFSLFGESFDSCEDLVVLLGG